jgi:hypothetical protein
MHSIMVNFHLRLTKFTATRVTNDVRFIVNFRRY